MNQAQVRQHPGLATMVYQETPLMTNSTSQTRHSSSDQLSTYVLREVKYGHSKDLKPIFQVEHPGDLMLAQNGDSASPTDANLLSDAQRIAEQHDLDNKIQYTKISNAQRINIAYSKEILSMKTAEISRLNGINYNSVRKIISQYNHE